MQKLLTIDIKPFGNQYMTHTAPSKHHCLLPVSQPFISILLSLVGQSSHTDD